MKKTPMTILIPTLALFFWLTAAGPPAAGQEIPRLEGREQGLLVFDARERHIDKVFDARARIEAAGGRVRAIFGLAALVAEIEPGSATEMLEIPGVSDWIRDAVRGVPQGDFALESAYAAWNAILAGPRPASGAPPLRPLESAAAPDLPRTEAERVAGERAYRRAWEIHRGQLPTELQRDRGGSCSRTSAGFWDTSLYLSGNVAVGVFYKNGTSFWTPGQIAATFGEVAAALDSLAVDEPIANLTFLYSNEVGGGGNPLPQPSDARTYDNHLRNLWCTDWAYLISVQNGGGWPSASPHGPSMQLDRNFSYFAYSVLNRTGVVFGAGNQFANYLPSSRYGYLQATHGNACGYDGQGYFGGAGECQMDLMNGWPYDTHRGAFTAGQLGWHDIDGDGLLDLRETHPVIDPASVSHSSGNQPFYSGIARDRPILNEMGSPYGDVSVEHVTKVEYQVNGSAWQEATPIDSVWDSAEEDFSFRLPPLKNGTYSVRIKARNSVGAQSPMPYQETLVVSGSNVTNTRPFPSFSITPDRGGPGTVFRYSALTSGDFETPNSGLKYYIYKKNSLPGSPRPISGVVNAGMGLSYGSNTFCLRVFDGSLLSEEICRTVVFEMYDTKPKVSASISPERRFGGGSPYSVTINVSATDAETPTADLWVLCDFDADGNWDTMDHNWTLTTTFPAQNWPRSERRRMLIGVYDETNLSVVERVWWVVPYDHRPTLITPNTLTFGPPITGPDGQQRVVATAHAADSDSAMLWDGMLEYRWDDEGDGIWETEFLPAATRTILSSQKSKVRFEVKDRFHAIAISPVYVLPGGPLGHL